MEIKTAQDIDAEAVRYLRRQAGETQGVFWKRVGMSQSGGWGYENGKAEIPNSVRLLLFAIYVAGIDLDSSTPDGAKRVQQIGNQLRAGKLADPATAEKLRTAQTHLSMAGNIINDIT